VGAGFIVSDALAAVHRQPIGLHRKLRIHALPIRMGAYMAAAHVAIPTRNAPMERSSIWEFLLCCHGFLS